MTTMRIFDFGIIERARIGGEGPLLMGFFYWPLKRIKNRLHGGPIPPLAEPGIHTREMGPGKGIFHFFLRD